MTNMIVQYREDADLQNLVDWVQQDWVRTYLVEWVQQDWVRTCRVEHSLDEVIFTRMNEWMSNNTSAQSLHSLLGVRQKVIYAHFKNNNNILKLYKL